MFAPPVPTRPTWLPLRLWLGSAAMAALFLLAQGVPGTEVARLLVGLPGVANGKASAPAIELLEPFLHTALLLVLALGLAFAVAFTVTIQLYRLAPGLVRGLPALGVLLAATPLVGWLWLALSGWISNGGVVETLLPERPFGFGDSWQETVGRQLWRWLVPTLALALPLVGLLLARLAETVLREPHTALAQGLRARGLSCRRMLDQHLLRLWFPEWRRHLEASLFFLLINALVVESVLRFPGWGWALVRALHDQEPRGIALCLYGTGLLAALVSLLTRQRRGAVAVPASLPPKRLGWGVPCVMSLLVGVPLVIWLLPSLPAADWVKSWVQDGVAVVIIVGSAAVAGPIVAALRLTVLGEWLRRYGLLETLIWSPLAVWAIAWSHAPGGVVKIDQALAVLATIHLSVRLHACTRRIAAEPHLLAAKTLGASPWQAWRHHALKPWARQLLATLLTLAAGAWWLRILSHGLLPSTKSDPVASLGSYLAQQATHALQDPLPLLPATLAASVSILFLWTLSRIIQPADDT